jgi:hypothetical protein
MPFDGQTYDRREDGRRLGKQLQTVISHMQDGQWRTLRAIAESTRYPESSVSARLRDIRKQLVRDYTMESERRSGGTWVYRMIPLAEPQPHLPWETHP